MARSIVHEEQARLTRAFFPFSTDTAVGRTTTPESWRDSKPTDLERVELIKVQPKRD